MLQGLYNIFLYKREKIALCHAAEVFAFLTDNGNGGISISLKDLHALTDSIALAYIYVQSILWAT